ncbi:MAG: hypothetical protein HFJ17_00510 [Clostridia bacterium]|nr:hypothetical protein [Clostridia bacterium]
MGKIESQEIKEYLKSYIPSVLEECELFTKTFGKNFARKRLELNLDKVYTNEIDRKCDGYMDSKDNSITYCVKSKDENPLKAKDIENDPKLQFVSMHEGIHSILERTKLECKLRGIESGTGLLETYDNGEELARGFNEGLTNWICEKAYIYADSYITLTDCINKLELAIGEEKVMKLGKGNIKKNVRKQLHMSEEECEMFLAIGDDIYHIEDIVSDIEYIMQVIDEYQNRDKLNRKEKTITEKKYDELKDIDIYNIIFENIEYKEFLEKDNKSDSIESRREYLEKVLKEKEEEIENSICEFNIKLFEKYFEAEWNKLFNSQTLDIDAMTKFDELYELIEDNENPKIEKFRSEYEELKKRYFESICMQAEKEFRNGTLSGKRLNELEGQTNRGLYPINEEFFNRVAKIIYPQNPELAADLLCKIDQDPDELEDVNKYSIIQLSAGERKFNAYQKNNEVIGTLEENTQCYYEDDNITIHEQGRIFDYTLDKDEHYESAIKQFIKLRQKVKRESPKTKIMILNRLITVKQGNKQSFYIIDKGNLLPANIENEPIRLNLASSDRQLPKKRNDGVFSKVLMNVKKALLRNSSSDIYYSNHNNNKKSKQNEFRNNISDMSQYGECVSEGIKDEIENDRNQDFNIRD